jgi:Helix-turn-helix domain
MHDYMTAREAAALLRLHPGTLANWRWMRKGPAYLRVEGKVLYSEVDLRHYLHEARR